MANYDHTHTVPAANVKSLSSPKIPSYVGINRDRQSRFEARSARRWGDWGILGIPTPILWMDDVFAVAAEDALECSLLGVVDLWPCA